MASGQPIWQEAEAEIKDKQEEQGRAGRAHVVLGENDVKFRHACGSPVLYARWIRRERHQLKTTLAASYPQEAVCEAFSLPLPENWLPLGQDWVTRI